MQNLWNKYGEDTFAFSVLEQCVQAKLNDREIYWIAELNTIAPNGMNLRDGGNVGRFSEEARYNMMEAQARHWQDHSRTEEQKSEHANRMIGNKSENSSSKYYGVSKQIVKGNLRWRSTITVNRKLVHIGSFRLELDAAMARDEYVIVHNLPHPLNFPD